VSFKAGPRKLSQNRVVRSNRILLESGEYGRIRPYFLFYIGVKRTAVSGEIVPRELM
jgi:hypothetical protein